MTRAAALAGGALAGVGAFNVIAWAAVTSPWLGVVVLALLLAILAPLCKGLS